MDTQEVAGLLVSSLVAEGFDRATITVGEEAGPLGLRVLRASSEGAYPGTGVAAAAVDSSGAGFGKRLPSGFGELVRARGWLKSPPAEGDLLQVLNVAAFDGLLAMAETPPTVSAAPNQLEILLTRVAFPSGAQEPLQVRVGLSGPAHVSRLPAKGPRKPTPIDEVTGLLRALDSDDPAAIMGAIGAIPRPFSPRALAAFARAATIPNEDIATTALVTMGGEADALAALRAALSTAPERRAPVAEWVGELYGSGAAAGL